MPPTLQNSRSFETAANRRNFGDRPRPDVSAAVRDLDLGRPSGDERILHVDMDAFYASVEIRDDRRLARKPVIVCGLGNRGVVTAASYEARRYGVFSAMPTARARRLCPTGVFLQPRFERYQTESQALREILESFTPLVEPLSLDEAFLDVTGVRRLFGDPVTIAVEVRRRIRVERGLPASVGVAASKLIAKLGSRAAKPDAVVCIPAGYETEFLRPLPVSALWGVGAATVEMLDKLGIQRVGDLVDIPASTIERVLGLAHGRRLHDLARGLDSSPVVVTRAAKSVSHSHTFEVDLTDADTIRTELLRLSDRVAARLRHSGVGARTVTVQCRLASFRTLSRSETLAEPVDSGPEVYRAVLRGYDGLRLMRPAVRLLGVAATGLRPGAPPRQLGFDPQPEWRALMRAQDAIRARYGDKSLMTARLLPGPAEVRGSAEGESTSDRPAAGGVPGRIDGRG